MTTKFLIARLVMYFLVGSLSICGQIDTSLKLEDSAKHPELSSDLSKSAKVKVYLSKKSYHLGEVHAVRCWHAGQQWRGYLFPK